MSAQRPNVPYQGGPKIQNYDRTTYNAAGYSGTTNMVSGGVADPALRQIHYVPQPQQQTDGYSRSPQPVWPGGAYLHQHYQDEIGRSQQPVQHIRANDFAGQSAKPFLNPANLHGSPVAIPGYATGPGGPQWINPMMHPSSEHMLPQQIQQIGSVPVSSFPSSHGSPDGTEYGSASNTDLSAGEMLTGREPHISDKEQLELKAAVQRQIEYYFSPSNLAKDSFLRAQMDTDRYVPVVLIAGFNCVRRLTQDLHLITDAIRASSKLEMDDIASRVRPRGNRSTLVIHDLPDSVTREDLVSLFAKQTVVKPVNYNCADKTCWYVEFDDEAEAKEALRYLREDARELDGKPISARIKALPISAGSVSPYMGSETSHSSSSTVSGAVPSMVDESVQQLSRVTGDLSLQQTHQYPGYAAFQGPNNQYFPQVVNQMNPGLMWTPQMAQMYDPRYYDYLAAMYMAPPVQQPPPQPPVYRNSAPVNSRGGRGRGRGNGNPNYASGNGNRRGRVDSYPNSGRNSAMSETRSEQNLVVAPGPQSQTSRHGSFSSVNGGGMGVTSPTDPRSGSSTPPAYNDVRARTNSGGGLEVDRRASNAGTRKPKRPPSVVQGALNDSAVSADQPDPANLNKEVQAKFDFEPKMFPPLPGQSLSDSIVEHSSAGTAHNPASHSANVSAADVVRGVSNSKGTQHGLGAWPDTDNLHSADHARTNSYNDHPISRHHNTDSSRKKEQASSTDDLPKSGRDHVGDQKLRSEPVPERPRMNSSSASTQTTTTTNTSVFATSSSPDSLSPYAAPSLSNAPAMEDGLSSPKKPVVSQGAQKSPVTTSGSPDGQHTSPGSRRDSFGVTKTAEDSEQGAADSGKSSDSAKNSAVSYARVAQLNRDKLPVASGGAAAGPGSNSGSGGGGGRVPLTKQSSLDSSSQSTDDKRSIVEKDHPNTSSQRPSSRHSGGNAKSNGSSSSRFSRPGGHSATANGHDYQASQSGHVNGSVHGQDNAGAQDTDEAEGADNEGFTEVIKHKQHHRTERNYRPSGMARHHGGPAE